ncbi:MAG: T9SS type B sorting domain-containing protein [Bacteroidota bacterium]
MSKLLSLGIILVSTFQGLAQNFVPNGSFELYPLCPTARNDGRRCYSWDVPTEGTADYFNTCSNANSNVDVPNNFAGTQAPRTGNAYSGIYASQNFTDPFLEYREYMQVTLDSFLIAGGVYTFEMWVSLGDNSNFASNKMAAYISAAKPTANNNLYLNVTPQIVSPTYITDKSGWTKITGVYLATGGEHYITIGVFEPAATNTKTAVSGGSNGAGYNGVSYYYIDDVSLTRACDLPDSLLVPDIKQCVATIPSTILSVAGAGSRAYLWSTGATTPTITVTQPGKYFVKVNTPFCTKSDTISIQYPLMPVADLGDDTTFCGAVNLNIDAHNPGATFSWSTGATTQTITAIIPGKYKVLISKNGCSFLDSLTISSNLPPSLDLGANDTLCEGSSKILSAFSPGYTYLWQDGSDESTYMVTTSGQYDVLVKNGVCSIKDSIHILFQPKPDLNLGPDASYCFQQPTTLLTNTAGDSYLWQDGSGGISFIATQPGLYWMQLTKEKCTVRDTVMLGQKTIPTLDLGLDRKVCKETSILIDFTQIANSAIWNDASSSLNRELKAPGLFAVTIGNADGCFASDTISLDTFPSPTVTIGTDSFVCEDADYQIDPGVYYYYTWQDGSHSRVFNATSAGTYYVAIRDDNSCNASDTLVLTAKAKPAISMVKLLRICNPDTLITPKGSFKTYQWQDGTIDTSYHITVYGLYTFNVTDTNNCANTATLEVRNNCPADIYVPNAFTPMDNDGLNDFFFPITRNVKDLEFKIYDRWGQLLFETHTINEGWDGSFMNKPATSDVYVYTVKFEAMNGDEGVRNGNVTLLR